jgi:hypothetical protein
MDEKHQSPPVHADVTYEERDTSASGVVLFGVTLLVAAVVIHVAVWLLFRHWNAEELKADKRPYPFAYKPAELPSAPQLEGLVQNRPGLEQMQAQTPEDAYGWLDRQKRIVRVPVRRAEELLAGKLPHEDLSAGGREGGNKK